MGQAGIQRGLALYAGHDLPTAFDTPADEPHDRPRGPEEISQADARVLTIALTAVLALDQRGLRPADDGTLRGVVTLAGHDSISYTIAHQPQPTELEPALPVTTSSPPAPP